MAFDSMRYLLELFWNATWENGEDAKSDATVVRLPGYSVLATTNWTLNQRLASGVLVPEVRGWAEDPLRCPSGVCGASAQFHCGLVCRRTSDG